MDTKEEIIELQKPEELIIKIVNKQYQHSIIKAARTVRRSRNLVNIETSRLEKYMNEQCKRYGQSRELVENGIKEYKQQLEGIKKLQDKIKAVFMEQKEQIQLIEFTKIASLIQKREERKNIKKSDEYKQYKTELNNLNKEMLKEMEAEKPNEIEIKRKTVEYEQMSERDILVICENEIQELKKDILDARKISLDIDKQIEQATNIIKDYLEEATKSEEMMLGNINKMGILQKIINSILNKIGGNKKFAENVVDKLNKQVDKMKTQIVPQLKEKMSNEGKTIIAANTVKILKYDGISEDSIDAISIASDKITEENKTYKSIITCGKDNKIKGINAILN